ncbi:hypothetical protein [Burkholderia ambifaria]|nr:hypothetical protein [Burkholderia ambifaria]
MSKQCNIETHRVLLEFVRLSEVDREYFIASMNEFLLSSPQCRHALIEMWGRVNAPARR